MANHQYLKKYVLSSLKRVRTRRFVDCIFQFYTEERESEVAVHIDKIASIWSNCKLSEIEITRYFNGTDFACCNRQYLIEPIKVI